MLQKLFNLMAVPKVRTQINRMFLLSSTVPIFIFGLFAIFNARGQMLKQYSSQLETDALRVNAIVFDLTTNIKISTANILDDEAIWALFNQTYTPDSANSYQSLVDYLHALRYNTAAISSICMYTDNPSIPEQDCIQVMPEGFSSEVWYQYMEESAYSTWICAPYKEQLDYTTYDLTLVEKLAMKNSPYNTYLVTRLDNNYIRNRLMTGDNLIMISVDGEKVFFSSDRSYIWKEMPCSSNFHDQSYKYTGPLTIEEAPLLTSIVTLTPYKTQNKFYIMVSDKQALHDINQITIIYLIILFFAILIPILLFSLYSSYFNKRIQVLRLAMHQVSTGDYNIVDSFHGDDELADVFKDLKATVCQIHEKEALYYQLQFKEQQLINEQQQMEFKMLANQINPHFLYNTLETIRMQAIVSNNRDVAHSIHLLGKTMHYVLENTGLNQTTLAKELEHVITYLEIQKLRFGDRVNYEIHVPPYLNLEQFRTLPQLISPIVENAIVHGLEDRTQEGMLTINFILEEPNLYITIHDNGKGMDEAFLAELRTRMYDKSNDSSQSIGLRNIDHRLRLLYGDESCLSIDSSISQGTTLTLTLPLDQIIDSDLLADIISLRDQYLEQEMESDE